MDRYEILRTSFHFHEGEFVQKIHPQVSVPLHVIEVQEISDQFCKEQLEALNQIPFRLDEVPLFRVELYVGPRQQYFLVLVMHHSISDGWSMTILNNEVAKIYNSLAERSVPDLSPLNFQFKDYADWHTALLSNEEWLSNVQAFWRNELNNAPKLELPYDYQTRGVRSFSGKTITGNLKGWGSIQQSLSNRSLTDFSFLLASVHTFLARTCDQDELVIGSPVAGRPLAQLEDQLGFFVNTLPIRLKSRENISILDFIHAAQQKFTELLDYQLLPYDQIMELGTKTPDNKPLVNVLMIYQNNDRLSAQMNEIAATRVEADFEGAIFDLVFIFSPDGDDLRLRLQYNDLLFDAQTAEEMCELLLDTLTDFSCDMDRHLADLKI
jgi:gramicidin S synthase 2